MASISERIQSIVRPFTAEERRAKVIEFFNQGDQYEIGGPVRLIPEDARREMYPTLAKHDGVNLLTERLPFGLWMNPTPDGLELSRDPKYTHVPDSEADVRTAYLLPPRSSLSREELDGIRESKECTLYETLPRTGIIKITKPVTIAFKNKFGGDTARLQINPGTELPEKWKGKPTIKHEVTERLMHLTPKDADGFSQANATLLTEHGNALVLTTEELPRITPNTNFLSLLDGNLDDRLPLPGNLSDHFRSERKKLELVITRDLKDSSRYDLQMLLPAGDTMYSQPYGVAIEDLTDPEKPVITSLSIMKRVERTTPEGEVGYLFIPDKDSEKVELPAADFRLHVINQTRQFMVLHGKRNKEGDLMIEYEEGADVAREKANKSEVSFAYPEVPYPLFEQKQKTVEPTPDANHREEVQSLVHRLQDTFDALYPNQNVQDVNDNRGGMVVTLSTHRTNGHKLIE